MKVNWNQILSTAHIRVLNINLQSVKNKTIELEQFIHSTKPDIIIGTETWLNSNNNLIKIFKPDWEHTVYHKERPNQSYDGSPDSGIKRFN